MVTVEKYYRTGYLKKIEKNRRLVDGRNEDARLRGRVRVFKVSGPTDGRARSRVNRERTSKTTKYRNRPTGRTVAGENDCYYYNDIARLSDTISVAAAAAVVVCTAVYLGNVTRDRPHEVYIVI